MNNANDESMNNNNQQRNYFPGNQFLTEKVPTPTINEFPIVLNPLIVNFGNQGNYVTQINNTLFQPIFSINPNVEQLQDIIGTKKFKYGNGEETQKLRRLPHYGQPYNKLEIYIKLGRPNKNKMLKLGDKYNEYFNKEIKEQIYPKFGRNEKRNMSLAVWFFEEHKDYIIPWLKKIGEIN